MMWFKLSQPDAYTISIGPQITVVVFREGAKVRVGIQAPKEVPVDWVKSKLGNCVSRRSYGATKEDDGAD